MEAERLEQLRAQFSAEAAGIDSESAASALRDRWTGRKSGLLTAEMKTLGKLSPDVRREFGLQLNALKDEVDGRIAELLSGFGARREAEQLVRERIDVTLPGRRQSSGRLHPITLMRERIEEIFVSMGYTIEDGPEIETDFYNFDALNIPPSHPARSSQDTLYLENGLALRSQTSTVQIHAMQRRRPPLRVIAPGRVYRRDTPDATHNPMFFQVEGLLVDRRVTLGDLKGTLGEFVRRMFGPGTRTRFRPSYFPFTEPSAEVDYSCFKCGGAGCRICKGSGWIELGGSGLVHPNVLRAVAIDPEEFSGFAFGLGIDRMCGLMYDLDDIRLLYENDARFLEQFR
ncbi:MAG: phenylalanine--tRNA ligase subunit alpha [Acidobacteria bacterium]|nr:phenylalanine--tRNA ligase subunit alpha [Acidobacteriota bacterium]MCW5967253.1 phenylalanine--tRNA ligase subunit alpha [Blastocatellales bacterium]